MSEEVARLNEEVAQLQVTLGKRLQLRWKCI